MCFDFMQELTFTMHSRPTQMASITCLDCLTSLEIYTPDCHIHDSHSCVLNLPGLECLYIQRLVMKDLVIGCPRLCKVTLEDCWIQERLFLPASLKECFFRRECVLRGMFPLGNQCGLTRLHCHLPLGCRMSADALYGVLPCMSELRTLELDIFECGLPGLLPGSLRAIRYTVWARWEPRNIQHVADACQLPELQEFMLLGRHKWAPHDMRSIQEIKGKSKSKIIMKDNLTEADIVVMERAFTHSSGSP